MSDENECYDGHEQDTEDLKSPELSANVNHILLSLVNEFMQCVDYESSVKYSTQPAALIADFTEYAGAHVELIDRLVEAAGNGMVNINTGNVDNEC
jgi:hypothetical protein